MKRLSFIFIIFITFTGISTIRAETDLGTGLHLDWFSSDEDDSGMQFYIPISASSRYNDLSVELLGAYVYTKVDPSDGSAESLSAFSDTKLNLHYEVIDRFAFDMLCSLGFNLPTGHTDLSADEMTLVIPSDLITISSFGEGFNINPSISLARQWEKTIVGIGIGYTWRGGYDYSYAIKDYEPGNILTLTGEIGHELNETWHGRVFGQHISYAKDKLDGENFYQEGRTMVIGCGIDYAQASWDAGLSLMNIIRAKSRFREGATLPSEERNSHGNEIVAGLMYRYFMDELTTLRSSLDYTRIGENDYDSLSPYYIGKMNKVSLGCGISRVFSERNIETALDIKGFSMNDGKNWYHPDQGYRYTGFCLCLAISKGF